MDAPRMRKPGTTAFVLSGGGSLGAVHVGMMRALLDWGETPSFVVGTSVGAINAAFFAGDPVPENVMRLGGMWRSVHRRQIFPIQMRQVLSGMFGGAGYLVDPKGLRRMLESNLNYEYLEQAPLPVHMVAADMLSGKEVVLSSGPAVEAILASTALPGVFPPVRFGTGMLVDGGLTSSTPISVAITLGAKRVIVLPTGYTCAPREAAQGIVPKALRALSILISGQLARDAEHWLNSQIELRIVPSVCPLSISSYDFSAAEELILRAHMSTQIWLEEGGLEALVVPPQLYPHEHFNTH